jgi:hypothetical protein
MKNLGVYLTIPLVILALGVIFLLARIVPQGWRLRLLTLAAFLLAGMPAARANETPLKPCYVMVKPEELGIVDSPQWAFYHNMYMKLLDYIASKEYNEKQYQILRGNLQTAEDGLRQLINDKTFPADTAQALFDGVDRYAETYQGGESGVTCYIPVQTPEFERSMTLFNIVGRQVELRRMMRAGTRVSVETMAQVEQDNYNAIKQYLSGNDLDIWVDLMDDLMTPR